MVVTHAVKALTFSQRQHHKIMSSQQADTLEGLVKRFQRLLKVISTLLMRTHSRVCFFPADAQMYLQGRV